MLPSFGFKGISRTMSYGFSSGLRCSIRLFELFKLLVRSSNGLVGDRPPAFSNDFRSRHFATALVSSSISSFRSFIDSLPGAVPSVPPFLFLLLDAWISSSGGVTQQQQARDMIAVDGGERRKIQNTPARAKKRRWLVSSWEFK